MQIYIARNGQQTGPFPLEEVNRQLAAGTITLSDQAWYDGAPGWIPLSSVPGVSAPSSPSSAGAPSPAAIPAAPSPAPTAAPTVTPATYSAGPIPLGVSPYGGFWLRLLAGIVDAIIISIATWPVKLIFGLMFGAIGHSGGDNNAATAAGFGLGCIGLVAQFTVYFFYDTLFTSSEMQATLGKKICGLKVTDLAGARISFGKAAARYVVKWFSYAFACIPAAISAFMVGLGDRKQALHDLAAGTYVMKAN